MTDKSGSVGTELFRSRPIDSHYLFLDLRLVDICDGNAKEALLLRKLMDWAECCYAGRRASGKGFLLGPLSDAIRRSPQHLSGDLLGLLSPNTVRQYLRSLAEKKIVVLENAPTPAEGLNPGDQAKLVRVNVALLNGLLEQWEEEDSPVRKHRVGGKDSVLQVKGKGGVWGVSPQKSTSDGVDGTPGSNLAPINNKYIYIYKDIINSLENQNKNKNQNSSNIRPPTPRKAGASQRPDLDATLEGNSSWNFDIPFPPDATVYGSLLDTATVQELAVIKRLLFDIHQENLIPFRFPAKDRPCTKNLRDTVTILLQLLRGVWKPGGDSPVFVPTNAREFRDKILGAARSYHKRLTNLGEPLKTLDVWVYSNHMNPGLRSSPMLYEIDRNRRQAQIATGDIPAQETLRGKISESDMRAITLRLQRTQDKQKPNPAMTWKALLSWHSYLEDHEKAIRFHGILHHGWYAVPTRTISVRDLLGLFFNWQDYKQEPLTAWLPGVGTPEWEGFVDWLAQLPMGSQVDLRATIADEATLDSQLAEIAYNECCDEISRSEELQFSEEVIVDTIGTGFELALPPGDPMLAQLRHLVGRWLGLSKGATSALTASRRVKFSRALAYSIHHLPELSGLEQTPAAVIGTWFLRKLRDSWSEPRMGVLEGTIYEELFNGLADD